MKKVNIIAHQKIKGKLLEFLQRFGWVHIENLPEDPKVQELELQKAAPPTDEASTQLSNIEWAIKFLEQYETPLSWWQKLQQQLIITLDQLKKNAEHGNWQNICQQCRRLDEQLVKIATRINELEKQQEELVPWANLDVCPQELLSAVYHQCQLIKIPLETKDKFVLQLKKKLGEMFELSAISADDKFSYDFLIHLKEDADKATSILTNTNVELVSLAISETPSQTLTNISKELLSLIQEKENLEIEAKRLAQQLSELRLAYDYWANQKAQAEIHSSLLTSEHIVVIQGWVNTKHAEQLKQKLAQQFCCFYRI
jgi:V/A-type H+-transporting ATPase subunit I